MSANLNMRSIQESVEDKAKEAREWGRKAYLTYLGVWGMGYDGLKSVYAHRQMWMDKAEKRGKLVEKELSKAITAYQKDFPGEVGKLAGNVQHTAGDIARSASARAEEWAKKAEKTVAHVVRRESAAEVVETITVEAEEAVKHLNGSGSKAAKVVQERVESAVDRILKSYDELSVKDIVAGLEGLTLDELEELRKHELAGKNRVTVVREIDTRKQAMTI